jgi:hypothetical protein
MDHKIEAIYSQLETQIDLINRPDYKELVNFSLNYKIPIHRWFSIKEGYSRELISLLFSRFDVPDQSYVMDPFCGSGTTLLTAKEFGYNSIGFEANPFLAFTSKVKLAYYSKEEIKNLKEIYNKIRNINYQPSIEPPKLSISKKLFKEQLGTVLMIKQFIGSIENPKSRDFFALALLCILEDSSFAKKDGNGLRYPPNKTPKNVRKAFSKQIELMIKDIKLNHLKNHTLTPYIYENNSDFINEKSGASKSKLYLFQEDCRKIEKILQNNIKCESRDLLNGLEMNKLSHFKEKVSLVVFSPPYMNCFDYTEIYKIELWFGDFVNEYKDLKKLRKKMNLSKVYVNNILGWGGSWRCSRSCY